MSAKILIVDDDLESLKLVGLMLQSRGYDIIAARSGLQALSKAADQMPDLVILDVMMPGMDGLEVCRRLRAHPATADAPIIMFTAKSQVEDKVAGLKAGADEYLTKPIHPTELLTRVEVLLARMGRPAARPTMALKADVIGFLGCKGGVGTSTLAINMAVALARERAKEEKVMLAEFRNGLTTLAMQLGLQPRDSLQTLAEHEVNDLNSEVVMAQMDRHNTGVMVLGGALAPLAASAPLDVPHVEAVMRALGGIARYLLVDMGVGLGEINQTILRMCDYVLVVVEPQRVALRLAESLLASLDELEIGRHRVGVAMVHKTASAATLTKGVVEEALQREVVGMVPPAPELAFHAADQGQPMVLLQPESLAARQLTELAEYLVGR